VGMTLQLILVPLIAFLFILMSGATTGVLIGLALLAAIPGGTVSNIFTYLGKGNIVLSIAITAITTLACLITTPIILNLLISQHMPADFVMPVGRIAFEITLFLLIPLIIGMVIYSKLPNHADGTAIQIEVTVRNTNLGLLLTASLFPPGEALGGTVLMTVLLYGAIMLILGAGLIVFNRRVHRIG